MTITTLDGLADGTDLAVHPPGNPTSRLRYIDGQVINPAGRVVDPWFLVGHLRDGHISIGDFRPPERGEWWTYGTVSNREYLVVDLREQSVEFAMFRNQRFYDWQTAANNGALFDTFNRTTRPDWASDLTVDLVNRLWAERSARRRLETQTANLRSAQQHLRYAIDYATSARNLLEGTP